MAEEHPKETCGGRRNLALGAAGLILALSFGVVLDYRLAIDRPLRLEASAQLTVRKGQGVAALARDLRERGLLDRPLWLRVLAWRTGVGENLKHGDYDIAPGTTPRALLEQLVSGRSRHLPITIIEGWTFAQMRQALSSHPGLRQEVADQSPRDIMARLGMPDSFAEGRFFPDTYFTSGHTSDIDILQKAQRKMQAVLLEEWAGRDPDLPFNSPEEALILASIVEKETGRAEERPAIAGVFIRRLRRGMRLQTDPTVIYGMGEAYRGNLRKDDLRRDTPYNTYTRSGLPPTPIALPGRQAIHAVLHPAAGSSLYFVARGDGTHVFSTSLEEHERAVDEYQRQR